MILKRVLLLVVFQATILSLSFGQSIDLSAPLSKQQMYEDFDEFVNIVAQCNAQLSIRKSVTGIDHLQQIKDLRLKIESTDTYYDFLTLLKEGLNNLCDIHAEMATSYYDFDNIENIDTAVIKPINQFIENYLRSSYYYEKMFSGARYFDGIYRLYGFYSFIDEKENDTISLHMPQIISYNDEPFELYVQKQKYKLRWDYQRKQYFSYTPYFPAFEGVLTVKNGKDTITINLQSHNTHFIVHLSDTMIAKSSYTNLPFRPLGEDRSKILYFEEDKVLYIYLSRMYNIDTDIIKKIGSGKQINKVIIDVRNNNGGNDLIWQSVLKAIIADTLPYDVQMAFKNTDKIKKYYSYSNTFTNIDSLKSVEFDWMPNEEFLVTNFTDLVIAPDSNSLKYKGKIYVLQNENVYSAAHSLTSYAKQVEQLISVGYPTGLLSGLGLNPALFQLPHSKFSFRLETAIDVTDVKAPIDVYQDFPEILIQLPLEERIKDLDYRFIYDQYCEEFLFKHDYLFKKVLEMK